LLIRPSSQGIRSPPIPERFITAVCATEDIMLEAVQIRGHFRIIRDGNIELQPDLCWCTAVMFDVLIDNADPVIMLLSSKIPV